MPATILVSEPRIDGQKVCRSRSVIEEERQPKVKRVIAKKARARLK